MIQKKVDENTRKAARTMWIMDYTKSNDCILWIHLWQNEHQHSVNDSWLYILGNLGDDRLQIVINIVLVAFIGKRESEMLPALSWIWVSMECHQLLAFHHRYSQRDLAFMVYIHGLDYFCTLKSSRILSRSTIKKMSCYCPAECGGNFPYISAYKCYHIFLYGGFWSSATNSTKDARPTIVDALLMLILKMW